MDEYIQQLLNDAGLPDSVDPEVRAQLVSDLQERAINLMNRRLIEAMSDEDIEAFNKLLDEQPNNAEAMQQFITDHVPNSQQVVTAAMLEFRALYLGTKV